MLQYYAAMMMMMVTNDECEGFAGYDFLIFFNWITVFCHQ
jgi:hypothetical protein